MNFGTPDKIRNVITQMLTSERLRSFDRSLINRLFNGERPLTAQQKRDNKSSINENFMEGPEVAHNANRQFYNAFLKPGNYFSVSLDDGPVFKRQEWSNVISRNINRAMKRSLTYTETVRSTFAGVTLHGIGPKTWDSSSGWEPEQLAIYNLLIPSNTYRNFKDLSHFAVACQYTPGKLFRKTHGKRRAKGWNMGLVNRKLAEIADENTSNATVAEDYLLPEKVQEKFFANTGYYDSDAVPVIRMHKFYYREDDDLDGAWQMRMLFDDGNPGSLQNDFVFKSPKAWAKSYQQIIHVQFGDGSMVPPFYYHSVRSIGYLLYGICHLQNRLRCRFSEASLESLMQFFRVSSPDQIARLQKVDLQHLGIIPEGLNMVTGNERFQYDEGLAVAALSQNKQLIAESSAAFTQSIDNGTAREMTATETMARVNSVNALVTSILNQAYLYSEFEYREIARRFCLKNSTQGDVKKFQLDCQKDGVPPEMLDVERWNIAPERTLGAGNKILEVAQADKLMAVRPLLDPTAQSRVLHIYVEANVDDPKLADELAPIGKKTASDSVKDGQQDSGVLMQGLPVAFRESVNHTEYIEALLIAMQSVIQRIEQGQGGMATADQIQGLENTANQAELHVQKLSEDESEKSRVKDYSDSLGKMMNAVKAYAQRLQKQSPNNGDGHHVTETLNYKDAPDDVKREIEAQAGLQPSRMSTPDPKAVKSAQAIRNKQVQFHQKQEHTQAQFEAEQQRKQEAHALEQQQKLDRTQVDIASQDLLTRSDLMHQAAKMKQDAQKPEEP